MSLVELIISSVSRFRTCGQQILTFFVVVLYSFAVKHYERVLEMAEAARPPVDPNAMDEDDDDEIELDENDFSRVAAYNLSQIYLIMENREEAIALSRKWLSV